MKESTFKKYCLVIDEWFVNGFNQRKSYMKFYPNASEETADVEMNRILSIPKISDYMKSKTQNKAEELDITMSKQLKRLDDIIESKDERATDKISAVKEQNKLLALYSEHNGQKNNGIIAEKVSIQFKNKR